MLSWNAWQAASAGGYDKTVDLLLSKGAEVNVQGGLYGNALQTAFIAETNRHEVVVTLLLEHGADVKALAES